MEQENRQIDQKENDDGQNDRKIKVSSKAGDLIQASPFKSPLPVPRKKVLDETKYLEELEKIIQRDFFPELEKLKVQNAYLNAIQNNDIHMLRELYSKYSSVKKTPSGSYSSLLTSPMTFETPEEQPCADVPEVSSTPTHIPMQSESCSKPNKNKTDAAKNLSVNQFLDKYTSEDNQSYQELVEESERKNQARHPWLYKSEKELESSVKASLVLPSIEKQMLPYQRPLNIDTWSYRNKNYIMYIPDGKEFTKEEIIERNKRTTEVLHSNTRFKKNPYPEANAANEKRESHFFKQDGKIGIDGKEIVEETPKVNGFSFVRTPSPQPGVEESPYMTWGEIEGTPFRLDGSDTPIPSTSQQFKIKDLTKREKLAMELADKASQRYRDRKAKAIEAAKNHLQSPSPRPMSNLERLSSMSPAARKLAASHLSSRLGSDSALRASYTPTRLSSPSSISSASTPTKRSKLHTPSSRRSHCSSRSTSTPGDAEKDLTDNLLMLPGKMSDANRLSRLKKRNSNVSNSATYKSSVATEDPQSNRQGAAHFF